MANLSEDIQCAGSDTRPPMLDRTDFASWQQCIRNEGPLHLGPEQPRVYSDLSPKEKERFVIAVKLNRGLRNSNYDQLYAYLKQHEGAGTTGYGGAQNRFGNANSGQARQIKYYKPLTAQTMFMENLSSADPVYDEAGPSYDSDILSENNVVDKSLTAELATYKEQVELYERRAKFELTEREQKIDEQLRIVITDRNIKEENLKKELHSVKMQLTFTINHNKSMVEEVTKHAEIKQKNLLIANDNLITDCVSKDVFYTATDYVLTVSRFSDMHEAFNAAQKRIAKLESKNSYLQNKIQNDDHDTTQRSGSKQRQYDLRVARENLSIDKET
nr:hypothetical protein [Tanacetum cinerariifolium]